MQSFLEEVVGDVYRKQEKLEDTIFVLPSKRAGTFLRNIIAKRAKKTFFSPEIYSIEAFVEKISGLSPAPHTQQWFELYKVYLKIENDNEKNDFYTFSKWANTLIQDFNEIDRYLIDAKKLFSNLGDIQEISHWSPEFGKTKMMEDYLEFWKTLLPLYNNFNNSLLEQGLGHQGLIYRHAFENLENYKVTSLNKSHIFIGFNALNKAETQIIQGLLSNHNNEIYWDIDKYFLEDPVHDSGFFLRKHLKEWPRFDDNGPKGISNYYLNKKDIEVVGLPKNVSQAKFVGDLLREIQARNSDYLKSAAVVLGDESLLNPVLNSIPENINAVNITMGYPLGNTSLADLFMQFINLYINKEKQGWYHRTILEFLSHPLVQLLFGQGTCNAQNISKKIISENLSFVQSDYFSEICPSQEKKISLLFSDQTLSPVNFLDKCLRIIEDLRPKLIASEDHLVLEQLYRFHRLFNQINDLVEKHPFISDLRSLQSLYQQLLAHETLDFQGEPLEGLQVMGMLESRNLDFETVILTSVNEGILPSGKSNNSFIPMDLKRSFGLPTYKEKDAVYTYHFYRLLQRAQNIYLLYNTEPDVLEGGEKSRLIMQLLTDKNKINDITETMAAPTIVPSRKELESISKDPDLMELIKNQAATGFSPTSLSNYIRNPLDFYKRNLLKIDDLLEVEENVAANTFGTIIHDTLEKIYTPLIGRFLEEDDLKALKPEVYGLVKKEFERSYAGGNIKRGKNLIAFNVIVKYIENFIDLEIEEVKNHQIKILGLEEKLSIKLNIPELDFPVEIKGKLDRIDKKDGELRIIDFKTGRVEKSQVEIVDWEDIITEYDRSKAFQLLCYAMMFMVKRNVNTLQAGIISIKKLNDGLFHFATKESKNSRNKNPAITRDTIEQFSRQLKKLILEICDPQIPFTEKEV